MHGPGLRPPALGGLAEVDALTLAGAILDDRSIDRANVPGRSRRALMARLGGHPLSLDLVLPSWPAWPRLSTRLRGTAARLAQGKAAERNESLALSLDFSLRPPGKRAGPPCDLAVFQGAAFEDDMLAITEMDPELWRTTGTEMEQAALVTVEQVPGINPPFLRFHPTLLPALAARLDPARRAVLTEGYWQRYYALVGFLAPPIPPIPTRPGPSPCGNCPTWPTPLTWPMPPWTRPRTPKPRPTSCLLWSTSPTA